MNIINVNFALLHPDAKQPTRSHESDVGNDLYALEDAEIKPGQVVKVKTGVAVDLPPGTKGIISDRSSMGSKGVHVFAGVIDPGYVGDLSVVLYNSNSWITPESIFKLLKPAFSFKYLLDKQALLNDLMGNIEKEYNSKSYFVKKGDRVAQLIVSSVSSPVWWKVKELKASGRGENGFGSSGK